MGEQESIERFDVIYRGGPSVEPHFCREWDEDGGCYGTNPDHGLSWTEACDEVARWHERQAAEWRARPIDTQEGR